MSDRGEKPGSTGQWFLQRFSAAVLVIYVGLHFVVTHYLILGKEITYQMVQHRVMETPWRFFYIGFLPFALFHGLNGIREIALDFRLGRALQPYVTWGCIVVGVVFFALGVWAFTPFR